MVGQRIGSLVGASFGLVYVLVNTGSLPGSVAAGLRVAALVAFAAVVVSAVRASRVNEPTSSPRGTPFGRGYWLTVAAEAVALAVGLWVLNNVLDRPDAGVAWVSTVVGLHFFALAILFRQTFFHWLGGAVTACGLAGLVLVTIDAGRASIDTVSGVCPGAVLLAAGWWGTRRTTSNPTHARTYAESADVR